MKKKKTCGGGLGGQLLQRMQLSILKEVAEDLARFRKDWALFRSQPQPVTQSDLNKLEKRLNIKLDETGVARSTVAAAANALRLSTDALGKAVATNQPKEKRK